jgi:murein DD-endopeptidase MepM/ murein hydrolase activator NlpD
MARYWRLIACAAIACLVILVDAKASDEVVVEGIDMQAPFAPEVSMVGGERQLTYEIYLTAYARHPLPVHGLTVLDGASRKPIYRLNRDDLATAIGHQGNEARETSLEPGQRTAVYLTIPLDGKQTPPSLIHRLDFAPGQGLDSVGVELLGGYTTVVKDRPPVLGPPLRGGPWVAVYSPDLERGHRRVIYASDGRSHIPGRHAIDWMRPVGWPKQGEGEDVLAVADAVVVGVLDGMEETHGDPAKIPLAYGTGNYVCLDLGNGRFAFYEHLLPGIALEIGDRVHRGQVIGRLGMTGHATAPHLHFHIADSTDPLAAEGLPYALIGAKVLGRYATDDDFFAGRPWVTSGVVSEAGLPAPRSVISFEVATKKDASWPH